MSDFDDIIDRLRAAAPTLDMAIERYAAGEVTFDPPAYGHLLTKVAAGVIVTGGVVAVPLLASRSGNDPSRSPSAPSTQTAATITAPSTPASPTLPSDSGTFTDAETWDAINWLFALAPYGPDGDRYEHLIVQDRMEACMNERGFEYPQLPFTPSPQARSGQVLVPPLPTDDDVELAGYAAFHATASIDAGPASSESDAVPATTDPELIEAAHRIEELVQDHDWQVAAYGTDTKIGSCIGEAYALIETHVGTEAKARYAAMTDAVMQLTTPLLSPPSALQQAVEEWRSCVGVLGQEVATPLEAEGLFTRQPGTEASPEEIATAHTDLQCRRSSGFREAYRDAIATAIANFRAENQTRLDDLEAATQRETDALRALAAELGLIDDEPAT